MYELVSEIIDQHNVGNPSVEVVLAAKRCFGRNSIRYGESFSAGGLRFDGRACKK